MIGNNHFPYRLGTPSYRRVSRKFQQMREGTVDRELAAFIYISTNIISSYQAIRKTDIGIPDIYLIRVVFQSMGNLEPSTLGIGTIYIKQYKRPASRKLGRD